MRLKPISPLRDTCIKGVVAVNISRGGEAHHYLRPDKIRPLKRSCYSTAGGKLPAARGGKCGPRSVTDEGTVSADANDTRGP